MLDIDTSNRVEQRKFGLVMAGAILVVGGVRWMLHARGAEELPGIPYGFLIVALIFAILGLAAPAIIRPVFVGWIRIALILNFLVTHVILTFAFVITVIPIGVMLRLTGRNPLDCDLDENRASYWERGEGQDADKTRYTKQY